MDKSYEELSAEWEAVLTAEGLGVISVDRPYRGEGIKHISGKHKALDAKINGITKKADGYMTNSPVTARAVESRFVDPDVAQSDFDDGLWDDESVADNQWDALALSLTASPKEAELADRARGALYGLDEKNRPRSGKVYRKSGESDAEYNARVAERLGLDGKAPESLQYAKAKPEFYMHERGVPCAHSDAGSGPLAIVDRPKPDYGKPFDESIRMSPVVDTIGYPSGRSPYQTSISRMGIRNSDITG
jgi:hypothetical protein